MLTDTIVNVDELFKLILENEDNVNVMKRLLHYLISENANPNIINKDIPLLHATCTAVLNPMFLTSLLLASNADPNIQSSNFMKITALHLVCGPFYSNNSFAQNGLLEILLNNGTDPNLGDSLMKTPFHYYCMSPNINEASLRIFLQKKADPLRISHDKTLPFGNLLNNPLVTLQQVKIFFEHGLNPNSPILEMKSTLFHLVCRHEAIKVDMLTYFIEQGADATSENQHGITPVHYYLQRKININPGMLAKLLQNIKNVDIIDNRGETLLYHACKNPFVSTQIVRFLLEKNANVSRELLSAKFLKAATKRNNELNVLLRKYFISNDKNIICNQKSSESSQLITKEFFIEKDEDWNNLVAMKPGSVKLVKQKKKFYLFTQVDSPEKKNSLLHIQIANSRDGRIDFGVDSQQANNAGDLLDYFALRQKVASQFSMNKPYHEPALSVQNSQGETPLLLALKRANPTYALCLLILDKFAKTIDVADKAGHAPLHIAYLFGLDDIVDFLLQRKANEEVTDIYGKKPQDYLLCDKEDKKEYIEKMLDSVGLVNGIVFQVKDKEMVINCLLERNQNLQKKLFPQISLNKKN